MRGPAGVYPASEWLIRPLPEVVKQSASLWPCRWWLGGVLECRAAGGEGFKVLDGRPTRGQFLGRRRTAWLCAEDAVGGGEVGDSLCAAETG